MRSRQHWWLIDWSKSNYLQSAECFCEADNFFADNFSCQQHFCRYVRALTFCQVYRMAFLVKKHFMVLVIVNTPSLLNSSNMNWWICFLVSDFKQISGVLFTSFLFFLNFHLPPYSFCLFEGKGRSQRCMNIKWNKRRLFSLKEEFLPHSCQA